MHPYIHTAMKAVRRAEEILSQGLRNPQKMNAMAQHAEGTPFALQLQLEAELAICDIICTAYPGHRVLSQYLAPTENEEETATEARESPELDQVVWHIHGLDGVLNYLRHIPLFTIEVSAEKQGKITHTVLFMPGSNDLFYAVRGSGACLNDRRLRITQMNTEVEQRILAIDAWRPQHAPLIQSMQTQFPHLRSFGSPALSLCYVAAGKVDAFYDTPFRLEACRAGYLIAKEAGALILDEKGEAITPSSRSIIAASPKAFRVFMDLFKQR